ncbi:LexA family transcriptional regulator [Massilia varians]|uniref:LexA family transcriptional regulator n=1 Tax=Massilia varians TaxID=457921 RepID=UPI0025569F15|nr:XRE family transcriptional regulator [Massilia varians]MDK6077916.1 XRE family transcriptional regulator [Massilia varians]
MLLSERIKLAMQTAGISQVELARACGVAPPSVHGWLSGKSKFLRGENLLKAARALRVSEDWLATGKGSMIPEVGMPAPSASASPFIDDQVDLADARPVRAGEDPDTVAIPRVKLRLRAGVSQYDTEPDMGGDGHELVPASVLTGLGLNPRNLIAVRVRGTSMEPMMFEDDVVIVDRSDTKPISREVYAVNFDGEACVKQLLYRGGQWYLHSINPDHPPVNVKSKPCSIVGRVVIQPTRVLTGRL